MQASRRRLPAAALLALAVLGGCASAYPAERLADSAWVHGDQTRALAILLPAAERGEAWAQLRVGNAYDTGQGVEKSSETAVAWYHRAAVQEKSARDAALIAQHQLARHYLRGDGVARDLVRAYLLAHHVDEASAGEPILFCCGFAGGSYLRPELVKRTLQEIEEAMPADVREEAEALAKGWTPARDL